MAFCMLLTPCQTWCVFSAEHVERYTKVGSVKPFGILFMLLEKMTDRLACTWSVKHYGILLMLLDKLIDFSIPFRLTDFPVPMLWGFSSWCLIDWIFGHHRMVAVEFQNPISLWTANCRQEWCGTPPYCEDTVSSLPTHIAKILEVAFPPYISIVCCATRTFSVTKILPVYYSLNPTPSRTPQTSINAQAYTHISARTSVQGSLRIWWNCTIVCLLVRTWWILLQVGMGLFYASASETRPDSVITGLPTDTKATGPRYAVYVCMCVCVI
jgi:hypothetical protein